MVNGNDVAILLNHIEDIVPDDVWERIEVELWNKVSLQCHDTTPQASLKVIPNKE